MEAKTKSFPIFGELFRYVTPARINVRMTRRGASINIVKA